MRKLIIFSILFLIILNLTGCMNKSEDIKPRQEKTYITKPSEIPDEKFREHLCRRFNLSGNQQNNWQLNDTTDFEIIKNINKLSLYSNYESSVSGIELFEKLNDLMIVNSNITEIDISKNLALNNLVLFDTEITELDVSNNSFLNYLSVKNENISELDITDNTRLMYIDIQGTKIRKLNCMNFAGKINQIECDENVRLVGVRQDMK